MVLTLTSTIRYVVLPFWCWCSRQKSARVSHSSAMQRCSSIIMETWKPRHKWNCDETCTHSGVKTIHTPNMTNLRRGKINLPAVQISVLISTEPSRDEAQHVETISSQQQRQMDQGYKKFDGMIRTATPMWNILAV